MAIGQKEEGGIIRMVSKLQVSSYAGIKNLYTEAVERKDIAGLILRLVTSISPPENVLSKRTNPCQGQSCSGTCVLNGNSFSCLYKN